MRRVFYNAFYVIEYYIDTTRATYEPASHNDYLVSCYLTCQLIIQKTRANFSNNIFTHVLLVPEPVKDGGGDVKIQEFPLIF